MNKARNESKHSLNGPWELQFRPCEPTNDLASWESAVYQTIPAQVPGNVECDLQQAGLCPDLTTGTHIYEAITYEFYQWKYQRDFTAPKISHHNGQRMVLIFEGIDCLAEIWLNNQKIGIVDNALIPHEFDVTETLVPGENTLVVCIDSAVLAGRTYASAPLDYALPGKWEAQHIRKAPHMYGWDIMPRIVSAGLWRDVYLEVRNATRFDYLYLATQQVDEDTGTATLMVDWQFSTSCYLIYDWQVRFSIHQAHHVIYQSAFPVFGTRDKARVSLKDIALWWPKGYGAQPLYTVHLELMDETGTVLAAYQDRIGIRTLTLAHNDPTPGNPSGEFAFVVNGVEMYARGTNWVPLDALHSRDKHHLPEVMPMLVDLNCNMVRCWGGNVYEDHAFFNFCDENGIMVWQDFAQGCNRSPQTKAFADKIRHEAEVIVRTLRNHPSLALWCGNNENDVALGWLGMDFIAPSTDIISREILPTVIRQHDPFRSYLPSSPYVSDAVMHTPERRAMVAEDHLWGPRGYFKDPFYTASSARFVSEVGYHGCPCRETLEQMMDPDFVYPWLEDGNWNAQWVAKAVTALPNDQKFGQERNNLMTKQVRLFFGEVPADLDDFIIASQITQAEAMKFLVEYWRQGKGERTGMLWWNLRDGWPILSDAVVDYYGRKKLAYYYLKNAQQALVIIVGEAENGVHPVYVVNDTREAHSGHVVIRHAGDNGIMLDDAFNISPHGIKTIANLSSGEYAQMWTITWTGAQDSLCHNHYLAGSPPFTLGIYKQWLPLLMAE